MRLRWLSCFLTFAFACSSGSLPDGVLPPDKMMPIVYDLIKADEYVNGYLLSDSAAQPNETYTRMHQQVFSIHKIDKTTFYTSFKYYQQHPDINKVLFDSIHAYANRQQNLLYQKKSAPQP